MCRVLQRVRCIPHIYFKINRKNNRYKNTVFLCAARSVEQCCGSGFTEYGFGYRSGPAFQVYLDPYTVPDPISDPVPDADLGVL
jgi:hypothetical protein